MRGRKKDRAIFIFESVLRSGEVSTKRKKKKALLSHEKVVMNACVFVL